MTAAVKERPILFSAPMVRAIIDGRKTQTRRVVKVRADSIEALDGYPGEWVVWRDGEPHTSILCPHGVPGDRLWVRETHIAHEVRHVQYRADYAPDPKGEREHGIVWKPSIFMPRWASRITLEITEVRVQRLQEISEDDAIAEGIEQTPCDVPDTRLWKNYQPEVNGWTPRVAIPQNSYRSLWDSINGKRPGCAWSDNPWVFAVSFRRIDG